jgi:ribosomal protein L11 methyltransferase
MYLWQRLAAVSWWARTEDEIQIEAGNDLAVIERPGRKRLILEISCRTRARADQLRRSFGGRVVKLPRDWLMRFARTQKTEPLRIGKRLVISNARGTLVSRQSRHHGRSHIVIPAGPAFGTGQHPTTAMSLRMLEQLTRKWKPGWSMADLGTGSGIFALAGKCFGARRVIAIDVDSVAISTAKANTAINAVTGVQFKIADALHYRLPRTIEVVTANLFSELLIKVIPKIRHTRWLILSGAMRPEERDVRKALRRSGFCVFTVRRRGKWIAALANSAPLGSGRSPTGHGD